MNDAQADNQSLPNKFDMLGNPLDKRYSSMPKAYEKKVPTKNTVSNLLLERDNINGYYVYSTQKYHPYALGSKAKSVVFSSHPILELEMYLSKQTIKEAFKKNKLSFTKEEKQSGGFAFTGAFFLSTSFVSDLMSQDPDGIMSFNGMILAVGSFLIGDTINKSVSSRRERTAKKLDSINLFNQDSLSHLSAPYILGKYDGNKYFELTPGGRSSGFVDKVTATLYSAEKYSLKSSELKELDKDSSITDSLFSSYMRMALAEEGQNFLLASANTTQDTETQTWSRKGIDALNDKIAEEEKNIEDINQEMSNEAEAKTFSNVFSYVSNL